MRRHSEDQKISSRLCSLSVASIGPRMHVMRIARETRSVKNEDHRQFSETIRIRADALWQKKHIMSSFHFSKNIVEDRWPKAFHLCGLELSRETEYCFYCHIDGELWGRHIKLITHHKTRYNSKLKRTTRRSRSEVKANKFRLTNHT